MSAYHVDELIAELRSRPEWVPFARGLNDIRDKNDPKFMDAIETLLGWARRSLGNDAFTSLAEGYVSYLADVNISQVKYEMSKRYAHRSYSEVFEKTYNNPEFMRYYHWGVFLSTVTFTHHLKLLDFYRGRFISSWAPEGTPRVLEIGSGSGVWSFLAAGEHPGARIDAVDISATSVAKAQDMGASIGHGERIAFHEGDGLVWGAPEDEGSYDHAVSCFLLEHLETPAGLLQNLARMVKPHGTAFVTLALTAAEVDHIYEFKRESEAICMAEDAGFRCLETLAVAPDKVNESGHFLPRSMGMILSRRAGEIW